MNNNAVCLSEGTWADIDWKEMSVYDVLKEDQEKVAVACMEVVGIPREFLQYQWYISLLINERWR
jgi:hypothetical protein